MFKNCIEKCSELGDALGLDCIMKKNEEELALELERNNNNIEDKKVTLVVDKKKETIRNIF